jgi:hypothetical protein
VVGDGVAYAMRGDVVVVVWQAPARATRGRWLFEATAKNVESLSSFAYLQIVLPTSSPPDKDMREEANRWLQRFAPKLRMMVTVPIGDALWVNVVRTIMRAMFVLQGRSSTHFVTDTVVAGVDKVRSSSTAETPSRDALLDAFEALLRGLDEDASIVRRGR